MKFVQALALRKILLERTGKKKRAIGVELENGMQLFADRVVSNADPHQTYIKMVGEENLSKRLQSKLIKQKLFCYFSDVIHNGGYGCSKTWNGFWQYLDDE